MAYISKRNRRKEKDKQTAANNRSRADCSRFQAARSAQDGTAYQCGYADPEKRFERTST